MGAGCAVGGMNGVGAGTAGKVGVRPVDAGGLGVGTGCAVGGADGLGVRATVGKVGMRPVHAGGTNYCQIRDRSDENWR